MNFFSYLDNKGRRVFTHCPLSKRGDYVTMFFKWILVFILLQSTSLINCLYAICVCTCLAISALNTLQTGKKKFLIPGEGRVCF